MSSPSKDLQYLRCLRCLKIIKCSRYDTNSMVLHVQQDHPEIIESAKSKVQNLQKLAAAHGISEERLSQISKMTGMSKSEMANEAERYLAKHKNILNASNQGTDWKNPHVIDSNDINRRQYYRSSIERWTPTEGCIYCPSCCTSRRPIIRSSAEFYASTGCSAACVANCWPFCFLPCLTPTDNREYLHCSNCKTFLGIYDRENNCIRPNREFVLQS